MKLNVWHCECVRAKSNLNQTKPWPQPKTAKWGTLSQNIQPPTQKQIVGGNLQICVHLLALMKKRLHFGVLKLVVQLKNLQIYHKDWFSTNAVLTVLQDIFYSGDVFEPVFQKDVRSRTSVQFLFKIHKKRNTLNMAICCA